MCSNEYSIELDDLKVEVTDGNSISNRTETYLMRCADEDED
jgi:hypothetical protein